MERESARLPNLVEKVWLNGLDMGIKYLLYLLGYSKYIDWIFWSQYIWKRYS